MASSIQTENTQENLSKFSNEILSEMSGNRVENEQFLNILLREIFLD